MDHRSILTSSDSKSLLMDMVVELVEYYALKGVVVEVRYQSVHFEKNIKLIGELQSCNK